MTHDEVKELLLAKIDSREKWEETRVHLSTATRTDAVEAAHSAFYSARIYLLNYRNRVGDLGLLTKTTTLPDNYWWAWREEVRQRVAYPPLSEVMEAVLAANSYASAPVAKLQFAHPSTEDPQRIARTMTAEDGQRDRQLVVSIDRWLRAMLPGEPDHVIQALAARHISEMDPSITISTDEAEIKSIYRNGPNACMSYSSEHYHLPDHMHPSNVYAHNGFGVAYMGTTDKPSARAVVWINPEDASDKRYVRVYPGASPLERKLKANGFVRKPFTGARMKAIRHEDFVVVPYMDRGCDRTNDGQYGAIYEGEPDVVHILSTSTANRLNRSGLNYARSLTSTAVRHTFTTVPESVAYQRCILSGNNISDSDTTTKVIKSDGTEGVALLHEAVEAGYTVLVTTASGYTNSRPQDEGTSWVQIEGDRITMTKRDADILRGSLCLLAEQFYPGNQLTYRTTVTTPEGEYILAEDSVDAVVSDGEGAGIVRWLHKDDARVTSAKPSTAKTAMSEFVTITPHAGKKVVVDRNAMHLIGTTASGRRVTVLTHDVKILPDGSMEYERNVESKGIGNVGYVWVRKSHLNEPWTMTRGEYRAALDKVWENRPRLLRTIDPNLDTITARPMWFLGYAHFTVTLPDGTSGCGYGNHPLEGAVNDAVMALAGTPLADHPNQKMAWALANMKMWANEWVADKRAELERERIEAEGAPAEEMEDIPF